ncbi:MAG: hypothetical protein IK131_00795 [Paludibacteraceae bacterium]|nr:hypothetical protein [Paludibacteraceae bacterium]
MRKLFLLSCTLLASVASVFAEYDSDKYWLVKDGKMVTENVTTSPYTGRKVERGIVIPSQMKDTVVDGEDRVVYRQLSSDYLDVKLKIDSLNPIDLSKYYVMVLEYMIPEEHKDFAFMSGDNDRNKPMFIIGMQDSMSAIEKEPDPNKCPLYVTIDAKFGKANKWVEVKKYLYANPSIKTIGGMVFSYAREKADTVNFPYIRNFYIESMEEGKPFYAENFDCPINNPLYIEKTYPTVAKVTYTGGIVPVLSETETVPYVKENELVWFRDYMPDSVRGTDGSGYMDDEILHGLQVEAQRDSIVFPGIQLPEGTKQFKSEMIVKKHKNDKTESRWDDADPATVVNVMDVPIKVRFNTGEIVDLDNNKLQMIWTKNENIVNVPAGATSMDLIISSLPVGYLVDNIMFTALNSDGVNDVTADAFEINAYIDANGNVVVLNGELLATYNMNGQVASINDKAIVIIVKGENGAIAAKTLIRK